MAKETFEQMIARVTAKRQSAYAPKGPTPSAAPKAPSGGPPAPPKLK